MKIKIKKIIKKSIINPILFLIGIILCGPFLVFFLISALAELIQKLFYRLATTTILAMEIITYYSSADEV